MSKGKGRSGEEGSGGRDGSQREQNIGDNKEVCIGRGGKEGEQLEEKKGAYKRTVKG